jgi:flavin reductase (DIM6/NTAB) family NADH-FMN oxidoreductase RutF
MDDAHKKTALRMIPYGLYVMTAENGGEVAAVTVNWVTQKSFNPTLVAVRGKTDSGAYGLTGRFALNILGKGQQGPAFAFFKPAQREGNTINVELYRVGKE